ncbi:serine/threonine-protein kinase [Streptomyces colonosanans]|uniref:non-specific serine/threonine protein kinase n=1 Tax=Streptomyces colonosanans TaxID=1428652 RepID=A0A1S2PZ55_9ACTN|nr:serine/threonine-protein kinase [Streptomyces colonosanans]OIJ99129.1 serine/threonine protein kinase [Streptomyces colonosanans]
MSEAERAGTSRQDKSERLLAGRYRLGDVLGRGGMGTVWRAKDETLGRTVAVKELRFPSSIDEEEKRRLITRTLREAKAIARIRNTGAVTVFDVVQEDDRPWIVMELIEGKSLAEAIREDGLLQPKRAAEVGLAVLDVLRAAHREGILHRDVKPSNVLIAEDGRVVLTDFGIAQVEGDPSITSTGMLVGAPSYISPERARGHKPGPAADLWSLGGLLYAAVEGVPPYDKGSAIATLTAVMTEPLEEPKNAGPLKDVIYGLLAKDPQQRLDEKAARAMLQEVVHAPDPKEKVPADATRVLEAPPVPKESPDNGSKGSEGKRGEEAAERLRGALRSVRKAAASTAPETAAGATSSAAASTSGGADAPAAGTSGPGAASAGVRDDSAAAASNSGSAKPKSGWPVVPDPDRPPRPTAPPRAPLTDVVSKQMLVIIAAVVALAVLGTVLALTLGDDKGSQDGNKGGKGDTKATASTGATAGNGSKGGAAHPDSGSPSGTATNGPNKQNTADTSPSASASASAEASSGSSGGDGAASTYNSRQGYSIGLPAGWKFRSSDSVGDRFTGPGGQRLLVGWTSTPKGDPVADWNKQERYMVRPQYKRIVIKAVDYRGWNTADWEFTYVDGGTTNRVVDRGFVVNPHQGYGLMYTAKADDWDGSLRQDTWKTLTQTFQPKS